MMARDLGSFIGGVYSDVFATRSDRHIRHAIARLDEISDVITPPKHVDELQAAIDTVARDL
jgi:hypothetical protein